MVEVKLIKLCDYADNSEVCIYENCYLYRSCFPFGCKTLDRCFKVKTIIDKELVKDICAKCDEFLLLEDKNED
jgi:hypothetical protein